MIDIDSLGFTDELLAEPSVYLLIVNPGEKIYVGSSIKAKSRVGQHISDLRSNRHANNNLQSAYNAAKEIIVVVKKVPDRQTALAVEKQTIDLLVNEQSDKILNICIDDVLTRKGTKRTEEELAKFSEKMRGHTVTEETRKKIGIRNKGKHPSEEVRRKMSDSHTGIPLSEEHKDRLFEVNEYRATPVVIDGKEYRSITNAHQQLGGGIKTIYKRAGLSHLLKQKRTE